MGHFREVKVILHDYRINHLSVMENNQKRAPRSKTVRQSVSVRTPRVREHSKSTTHEPSSCELSKMRTYYKPITGASLVAQWLRIHLPVQGTWVRALVREDPTCCRATKPVRHNYWACALEPMSHNYWSPCATTTEARVPRACALQQEKPPQWEACAPQQRVAPTHCN